VVLQKKIMKKSEIKEERYNKMYMDIAARFAAMSFAIRLNVGAVIVKNDNIISFGWNGMPTGWDNNCEDVHYTYDERETLADKAAWAYNENNKQYSRLKTKPEVLHAESNAIAKLAKSSENSDGATLYCTHAPCMECSKLIFQSGIKKVYYRNQYRSGDGIRFLEKSGVDIKQI
jgi:dCMP deaminase